jgi:hypothetical protein
MLTLLKLLKKLLKLKERMPVFLEWTSFRRRKRRKRKFLRMRMMSKMGNKEDPTRKVGYSNLFLSEIGKELEIETKKGEKEGERERGIINERLRSDSFRNEFESPGMPLHREHSFDLEPFLLNQEGANFNLLRSNFVK